MLKIVLVKGFETKEIIHHINLHYNIYKYLSIFQILIMYFLLNKTTLFSIFKTFYSVLPSPDTILKSSA